MATTNKRPPETLVPEAVESPRKRIVPFIRRHAVATYYALTFAITWGVILLVVGPDGFFATGSAIAGAGAVAIAGPAVAGVLMTGLVDGRAGLRSLVSRLRRWRVGVRWYAVALLTGPLVMAATVFGLSLTSSDFRPDIVTSDDKLSIVAIGIAIGLVGPFLEELGWTGFAQPRLRRHYSVLTTGLVMGLLWSAWHFPLFAGERDPEGTVPAAVIVGAFLLAWLPPYRVLMVWVYDRTESLLLAYLMHVPISTTAFILASESQPGTAAVTKVLVWGAAFWVIVGVVAWANKAHLPEVGMACRTKPCRADAECPPKQRLRRARCWSCQQPIARLLGDPEKPGTSVLQLNRQARSDRSSRAARMWRVPDAVRFSRPKDRAREDNRPCRLACMGDDAEIVDRMVVGEGI